MACAKTGVSCSLSRTYKPVHQHGAKHKRHAPAPAFELIVAERHRQAKEQPIRQQETDRGAELGKHAKPGAFARRGILGGEQGGTAPFAAQAYALTKAQHAKQQGRQIADGIVAGQEADQGGGYTHHRERGHQRGFAADAVTKVTKQGGAERACQKAMPKVTKAFSACAVPDSLGKKVGPMMSAAAVAKI